MAQLDHEVDDVASQDVENEEQGAENLEKGNANEEQ